MAKNHPDVNFRLKFHIAVENYLEAKNDLESGADINNINCDDNGRSILHIAAIAHKPTIAMINFLVENGANNFHHKDTFGKSPLYYLLIKNHFDVAEFMIRELKAEIHQKDFADKPKGFYDCDKSVNFQQIINWCKDLSSRLKTEEIEAAKVAALDMLNELSDGYLAGTYLGRFPQEIINLVCKEVCKKNMPSEFYHEDGSTPYGYNDDIGKGADVSIAICGVVVSGDSSTIFHNDSYNDTVNMIVDY